MLFTCYKFVIFSKSRTSSQFAAIAMFFFSFFFFFFFPKLVSLGGHSIT